MKTFFSDLSNKEFPITDRVSGKLIRQSLIEIIQQDHPDFTVDKHLSISELDSYREKYIKSFMTKQVGEITELEKPVLDSLIDKSTITDKLDGEDMSLTFGQKIADQVASFGGSWTFIILFFVFLFMWLGINVFWLANKGFDPYPFILLNLILSSLAAIQAPIIMMSQNRQEDKDRERAKKDYMVNLKSELEIKMLHEKIDHLIINEQQDILKVHNAQLDILNDILERVEKTNRS